MVRVTDHSISKYVERILGVSPEHATDLMRKKAIEDIEDAAEDPIAIYQEREPPIHIKNGIAVPYDYDEEKGDHFVPTVYPAGVFAEKINDRAKA